MPPTVAGQGGLAKYTAGMALEFCNVSHRYVRQQVLRQVSLRAQAAEITCLLGPSGSGKSTLLRLAAGLERLQSGSIRLDGEVLAEPGREPPPERRPVGLVFQDHVLFPHKTVRENIAFGLRALAADERARVVERCLLDVGLQAFGGRYPDTLSGGQQQRVALARALAPQPRVLLLDEPFANVDATLRRALREQTRRALRRTGRVALVVTHDPDEALELADRIVVLGRGGVLQAGTPAELWRRPETLEVAEMFGQSQHLRGTARSGFVRTRFGGFECSRAPLPDGEVDVVARPNAIALRRAEEGPRVEDVRFLGERYFVLVRLGDDLLRVSAAALNGLAVGDPVTALFDAEATFVFPRSEAR